MNTTQFLKARLWERYGTSDHPAEWDGLVYGGGKLSQRYWEYLMAIELLALTPEAVVLDLGGGSPSHGAGFFASLLAGSVRQVLVMDPEIPAHLRPAANLSYIREAANAESLGRVLQTQDGITHVASISVFEHIDPQTRAGIMQAIDDHFRGHVFVTTFEFHPSHVHFEHQLTHSSASALFGRLTRFYPDRFEASPVWSENALDRIPLIRLRGQRNLALGPLAPANIPLWHPVALRFLPRPANA